MKETETSNLKQEFSDVTQSDPAASESFSQFEESNNGTEIPYLEIKKNRNGPLSFGLLKFKSRGKNAFCRDL